MKTRTVEVDLDWDFEEARKRLEDEFLRQGWKVVGEEAIPNKHAYRLTLEPIE